MNIQKLNAFKKASGLTNAKIAEITGITLSNIDKITSGNNTNPKLDTIQAICKAIGCTVDDLDDTPTNLINTNYNSTKLNEFVNQRRKELNMSVDELVKKSGIPKGTLSKITAGINSNPTLSTVEALCKALNCSLNDIAGNVQVDFFSISEKNIIKKYRILDEYGKKAVDEILEIEYDRCTFIAEKDKSELIEVKVAARSKSGKVRPHTEYITKEQYEAEKARIDALEDADEDL